MRDPAALPRTSAPISRPRTPTRRPRWPIPRRCRRRSSRRCAGASRRTIPPSRRPTAPWPTRALRRGRPASAHLREPRGGGAEQVLLDGNALAAGHAFFRIGGVAHSPDHRLLAWSHDDAGSEFYTLRVRDLETGQRPRRRHPRYRRLAGVVGRCAAFFYVRLDANHRPSRVFRHRARHAARGRRARLRGAGPGFFVGVGKTQSDRFVVIRRTTTRPRKCWLLDPGRRPTRRRAGRGARGRQYDVEHHPDEAHGRCFILTNAGRRQGFQDRHRAGRARPAARTGATSCRTAPDGSSSRIAVLARLSSGWSARTACRASSCAGSPTARSTSSPSTRRPIRSAWPAATSSTPTRCASPIRRWRRRRASTTTTWRRASGSCARSRRSRPATIPPLYVTRRIWRRPRTARRCRSRSSTARTRSSTARAPCLLYGYGAYGIAIPAGFSADAALAGRPRLRLRHRACPRRQGQGLAWYEDGKREHEAEHLLRFHRRGRASVATRLHVAREDRRGGRLGRRHADGRGRQHAAGPLRRHHRRGAVRRRAQHHARRHAAADAARMAGMGQPDRRRAGVPHHPRLFALRQRAARRPIRRSSCSPA